MPVPTDIYAIADRLAPRFRRQFIAAVVKLRGRITVRGILNGSTHDAFGQFVKDLEPSAATLNVVFERSAKKAERELGAQIGARFDILNPLAVEAASQRSSLLIREISTETRRAIQQSIVRGMQDGIPPRKLAKQIKPLIGLTGRDQAAVLNYRISLQEAGALQASIQKQALQYRDRLLTRRATNIARTETIRSFVDGQQEAWLQARTNGLLADDAQQVWITADDERRCPICGGLEGKKARLMDSFRSGLSTYKGPPAHPQCRCAVSLIFGRRRR